MSVTHEENDSEGVIQLYTGRWKSGRNEPEPEEGKGSAVLADLIEKNRHLERRNFELRAALDEANARLVRLEASVASVLQSVKLAMLSAIQMLESTTSLLDGEGKRAGVNAVAAATAAELPQMATASAEPIAAKVAALEPLPFYAEVSPTAVDQDVELAGIVEVEEVPLSSILAVPFEDEVVPEPAGQMQEPVTQLDVVAVSDLPMVKVNLGPQPMRVEMIAGPFRAFASVMSFYGAVKGEPGIDSVMADGFDQNRLRLSLTCMDEISPIAALLRYEGSNVRLVAFRNGRVEVETD
jgi:hypothetical protein